MWNSELYGNYRNRTFADIWPEVDEFLSDYSEFSENLLDQTISDTAATTLFYLLYARYGNSTVASSDENQFKYKLFSLIFTYGPTWEKRLEIQKAIRNFISKDENGNITISKEVTRGGKAIYNSALNPSSQVSGTSGGGTNSLEELTYINAQNTTNYVKSTPEAYAIIWDMMKTDVTTEFLSKFKKLFLIVVSPELPLWYITDTNEGGDSGGTIITPPSPPQPTPTEPEEDPLVIAELQGQIAQLQSQIDEKDQTINSQNSLIENLQGQVNSANETISTLQEENNTLNTANESLMTQKADWQNKAMLSEVYLGVAPWIEDLSKLPQNPTVAQLMDEEIATNISDVIEWYYKGHNNPSQYILSIFAWNNK